MGGCGFVLAPVVVVRIVNFHTLFHFTMDRRGRYEPSKPCNPTPCEHHVTFGRDPTTRGVRGHVLCSELMIGYDDS